MLATDALAETMRSYGALIDRSLDQHLGQGQPWPARLRDAMRYSVFAGGKRLRPILVLLASDACVGPIDAALPAACAVEMIHTYSLIHDDLPAMDDDDLRRGQPTCHLKFDEATAILAGDALLTLAFQSLAEIRPPAVALRCVEELSRAAGSAGMVGGQMDDLSAAEGTGDLAWLQSLHSRKTGALLTVSLRLGGLIAGADEGKMRALTAYGQSLGLAFQIADDLLDAVGNAENTGKGVQKDQKAGKLTYPLLIGVEESRRRARELADAARDSLRPLGPAASRLAALADYVVERDR